MKNSFEIFVRCIGRREDSQWTVVCLNFDLAAQAVTFEEARDRLEAQIREYVRDAMSGEDRAHASYLMNRRAPLSLWLLYYVALLREKLNFPAFRTVRRERPFREPLHLSPC